MTSHKEGDAPAPGKKAKAEKKPGRGRQIAFRAAALVGAPLLFFGLAEGALRIVGAGYTTDFFLEDPQSGNIIANAEFTRRFFPGELAREPLRLSFPKEKQNGTFRIFILGESAAMGDPMPAYGFSRILRAMLESADPDGSYEVINTGVTAISSHVVAEIAEDCADYEPDLFVVLMGNNEAVGPYGPGTVLTPLLRNRLAIKAHMGLKSLRTAQTLEAAMAAAMGRGEQPGQWMGMEMFLEGSVEWDSAELEAMHRNYEANYREIIRDTSGTGADVMLMTVPVNLHGTAPFGSKHSSRIRPAELNQLEAAMETARLALDNDETSAAREALSSALEADGYYADAWFLRGRLNADAADYEQAATDLAAARDRDTLRFRTDSRMNAFVRSLAAEAGVRLVDAEAHFAEAAAPFPPGDDLLYEHVHFRFSGNYLLAKGIFDQLRGNGLVPDVDPPSEEECRRLLGFDTLAEVSVEEKILARTSRPPFTNQIDFEADQSARRTRIAALRERITPEYLEETDAWMTEVAEQRGSDGGFAFSWARVLYQRGRYDKALEQLRIAENSEMRSPGLFDNIGRCLLSLNRLDEAEEYLRRAIAEEPSLENTGYNLSLVLAAKGNVGGAMQEFEQAHAAGGDRAATALQIAGILERRGGAPAAIEFLNAEATAGEGVPPTFITLSRLQRAAGNTRLALAAAEQAVQMAPGSADARLERVRALQAAGQREQAEQQLDALLRAVPGHPGVEALKGQFDSE